MSIGKYTLEAVLGEGGMGRVYLGQSLGGRKFAVKVIRPDRAHDPRSRARFRREVEVARRVGGVHTPAVDTADPDGETPWLATTYVPGPTLTSRIAQDGPLGLHGLARLGAGLAEALLAFHEAGVIHRDLKPDNVIMAPDGPYVVDFGIAYGPDSTRTASGLVSGTEGFTAPELFVSDELSPACDVFAFGVLLVHAAGGLPFGDARGEALRYRVQEGRTDVTAVPEELRPLAAACLAADPAARPSAEELLGALAPFSAPARTDAGATPDRMRRPSLAEPAPAPGVLRGSPVRGPGVDPGAATETAHGAGSPPVPRPAGGPDGRYLDFRKPPWRQAPGLSAAVCTLLAPSAALLSLGKPWPLALVCLPFAAIPAACAQAQSVRLLLAPDGVSFTRGVLVRVHERVPWEDVRSLELRLRGGPLLRVTTRNPPPSPAHDREVSTAPEPYTVHRVWVPAGARISASAELAGTPRSAATSLAAGLALFAPDVPVQPLERARKPRTADPHVLSARPRATRTVLTTLLACGQLTAAWSTHPAWAALGANAAVWALLIRAVRARPWRVHLNHRGLRVRGRRRTGRRVAANLPWSDVDRTWHVRTGRRNELHLLLRANAPVPPGLRGEPHPDGVRLRIPLDAALDPDTCAERIGRYAPPRAGAASADGLAAVPAAGTGAPPAETRRPN
ncbi:protein kinase [Streptomyces sp. NPDC059389]|uniref:protein kinase domain-containing protein n=1 Tax=Streptomyces sp. NPDC059389 TaxID=3346818 RepID=UPI0036B88211